MGDRSVISLLWFFFFALIHVDIFYYTTSDYVELRLNRKGYDEHKKINENQNNLIVYIPVDAHKIYILKPNHPLPPYKTYEYVIFKSHINEYLRIWLKWTKLPNSCNGQNFTRSNSFRRAYYCSFRELGMSLSDFMGRS